MSDTPKKEPTPRKLYMKNEEWTLFRDGTTPVYLTPGGKFAAEWAGKWVVKKQLDQLDKVIQPDRPSVRIFCADSDMEVVDAAQLLDNKIIDKDGKRHWYSYGEWYVYDQAAYEQIKDINRRKKAAEEAFKKEREAITRHLRRAHRYDFEDVLAGDHTVDPGPTEEEETPDA